MSFMRGPRVGDMPPLDGPTIEWVRQQIEGEIESLDIAIELAGDHNDRLGVAQYEECQRSFRFFDRRMVAASNTAVSPSKTGEYLHWIGSIAWLFMDFSWMAQVNWLALTLVLPTVGCSIAAVFCEKRIELCLTAASVACWAIMNSLWMANDLKVLDDPLSPYLAFIVSLLLMGSAFACVDGKKMVRGILNTFRRGFP